MSFDIDKQPMGARLVAALAQFPSQNSQALDYAHAHLIAGLVLAHKPLKVLELGVGSAYLTSVVLEALRENGRGRLTSVDNFFDWNGKKPFHIIDLQETNPDWDLIVEDESIFLQRSPSEAYTFIISDGDHTRGYQTAPDLFRTAAPGSVLVFHDTSSEIFRLLARLPKRCRQLGFDNFHFNSKSKPEENTDRGLLVVGKQDRRRFSLDSIARLYLFWRDKLRPLLKTSKRPNCQN